MRRQKFSSVAATRVDYLRPSPQVTSAARHEPAELSAVWLECEADPEELPDHELTECDEEEAPCQSGVYGLGAHGDSESSLELSMTDLEEEPARRIAVVGRHDTVRVAGCDEVMTTADLQQLLEQNPSATPTDTVMFYRKPGESLPPYAVHAEALPRFASRKLERLEAATPTNVRIPRPPRLPSFSIHEEAPAAPPPPPPGARVRRIPPVRLPAFRLEEERPRSRLPAPKLPKFILE
jgi:hypothetical protein